MKHFFPSMLAPVLACFLSVTAVAEPARPNIIILLADDLGYADLGCQGSTEVVSPQIDSIAANGVRLTAGYVSAPQCCPSRAGLITGRYQNRFGFEANWPAVFSATSGLPTDERTMGDYFKAAGYATGMIGKWHLGDTEAMRPYNRGFDETLWHPNGGVLFPDQKTGFLNNLRRGPDPVQVTEYSTDAFGLEAVDFIDRHQHEPFFLYVSFVPPHWPMEAKPEHLAQFAHIPDLHRRTMLAMMASLDENVGRVLTKLRETKLEENTLVFFLSDNGGPTGRNRPQPDADFEYGQNTSKNDPCRGVKGELLEGGIRIPFMVQWKGRIPAGKTIDEPVISLDLLPTALAAAGVALPPEAQLDGTNILPYLTGTQQGAPHEALYWRFRFPPNQPALHRWAIRQGDWKLVKNGSEPIALYNLARDIGESVNLASAQPGRVEEMHAAWKRWDAMNKEPLWTDTATAAQSGTATSSIRGSHQVVVQPMPNEILIQCQGNDPAVIFSEIPAAQGPYTLELNMKSQSKGLGQVFWTTAALPEYAADRSVTFEPRHGAAQWLEYAIKLPVSAAPITTLRLDPASAPGLVRIARMVLRDAQGKVVKQWIGQPAKDAVAGQTDTDKVQVAVYYFPNWGPVNQSEWRSIMDAKPQFEGHAQPKVPVWGYENENLPPVMARKIDAAADHGIDAFIFDWYYYDPEASGKVAPNQNIWDGSKYLYSALEKGYLGAPNNDRLKFSVMWCNHDLGTMAKGAVRPETFENLTDYVIKNYFKHPSYWKLDGRPYFSIYDINTFLKTFGGDREKAAAALARFREKVKAAGFPDLHLNAVLFGLGAGGGALAQELKIDSLTSYVWIHHNTLPDFPATEYGKAANAYFRAVQQGGAANGLEKPAASLPVPYHLNVSMGWDSSPRCKGAPDWMTRRGYPFGAVIVNNTPEAFRTALVRAKDLTLMRPLNERIITINSWNEWGEGSYLEPDTVHGLGYLEAIQSVFTPGD